jgi:DNA-directed RNA polymerase specialized sigma24 family protein
VNLDDVDIARADDAERWLLLDDALARLAREDATTAEVAKLRPFAGLPAEEAAALLSISRATALSTLDVRPRLAPGPAE